MKGLYQQFADWVGTKPPAEAYDYLDTHGFAGGCAFFQFLREAGYPVRSVACTYWRDTDRRERPMPDGINEAVGAHPRTFGALADRLATLRVEQSA